MPREKDIFSKIFVVVVLVNETQAKVSVLGKKIVDLEKKKGGGIVDLIGKRICVFLFSFSSCCLLECRHEG